MVVKNEKVKKKNKKVESTGHFGPGLNKINATRSGRAQDKTKYFGSGPG